ncbi:MAG: WD40 repeat domain-containing protein [Planctomycetota bacterium]
MLLATLLLTTLLLTGARTQLRLVACGSFDGVGGGAQAVDMDATGDRALSCGSYGDVVLWDTGSGAVLGRMDLSPREVGPIALHPNGRLAAVIDGVPPGETANTVVRLVDMQAQRVVASVPRGRLLAWNERGDVLAVRDDRGTRVFALGAGGALGEGEDAGNDALQAFSGRWRGLFGAVRDDGTSRDPYEGPSVTRGDRGILASRDGDIHAWRRTQTILLAGHRSPVLNVCWSPDATHVAARGLGGVVFATADGKVVRSIAGCAEVAAGRVRDQVWILGTDRACLWEVAAGKVARQVDAAPGARADVTWTDGSFLALAIPECRTIPFTRLGVGLNGNVAVRVRGREVPGREVPRRDPLLWRGGAATVLRCERLRHPSQFIWLARDRDATRIVVLAEELEPNGCLTGYTPPRAPGSVSVFDADGGTLFSKATDSNPSVAAFAPDGRTLAVALRQQWLPARTLEDGPMRAGHPPRLEIWDAATGTPQLTIDADVDWLAYLNDGRILTMHDDRLVVRDAGTLRVRQTLVLPAGPPVQAADLSADGKHLALGRRTRVDLFHLTK